MPLYSRRAALLLAMFAGVPTFGCGDDGSSGNPGGGGERNLGGSTAVAGNSTTNGAGGAMAGTSSVGSVAGTTGSSASGGQSFGGAMAIGGSAGQSTSGSTMAGNGSGATGVAEGGTGNGGSSSSGGGSATAGSAQASSGGTIVTTGGASTAGASGRDVSIGGSGNGGSSSGATGGIATVGGASTGGGSITAGGSTAGANTGGNSAATGGASTGGSSSACVTNSQRCNASVLEVCNASHQWATQQICAQTCDAGGSAPQCVATTACAPSQRRCSGNLAQVCNTTGTAWLTVQACIATCSEGLCTGTCSPGEQRCDGKIPQTCDANGTTWVAASACAGSCWSGACAEPDLVIDANANATLEGEHFYDGDVVLKNSSVLTSNTGKLIIHANSVTIDATSKIVIAPTGDDPRGRGQDGVTSNYCSSTGYYFGIVASGAGNGTAGETKASCSNYYGSCYCSATRTGGLVFGIADDELASGSSGGKCDTTAGGKGGGYLGIYANTIVIQGQITAFGAPGTTCAGGGSGGSVVLRANSLTFSGSISTAGGAGGPSGGGKGGDGVVKFLYGNSNNITGTVTGAKYASFMPPNDVGSATHPRQDRWYNDGYRTVDLAWSKPFSNGAGYYERLNTTYGFVPSPSNADYLSGESISFQATAMANNTINYLHVDTLGPFATLGTVESRYLVRVNGNPPIITSSSHPTATAWYANASPYLSWVLPNAPTTSTAIPDSHVTGFYWVWDHFLETIPTTSDNHIPMDLTTPQNSKQLLLPGNANGIWFFHIIAQDTMGYLTKTAATFRVQIGNAPATLGAVSGVVSNASTSTFVSGATVTLNRGVFNGSTTTTGTYSIQNVVPGTYEIRVRNAGFTDSTSTVTVTGSQTSTANFTLTPSP